MVVGGGDGILGERARASLTGKMIFEGHLRKKGEKMNKIKFWGKRLRAGATAYVKVKL